MNTQRPLSEEAACGPQSRVLFPRRTRHRASTAGSEGAGVTLSGRAAVTFFDTSISELLGRRMMPRSDTVIGLRLWRIEHRPAVDEDSEMWLRVLRDRRVMRPRQRSCRERIYGLRNRRGRTNVRDTNSVPLAAALGRCASTYGSRCRFTNGATPTEWVVGAARQQA